MKISKIFLYDEPSVPEIKIGELAQFIQQQFRVKVEIRENIFSFFGKSHKKLTFELASSRIFNTMMPFEKHNPTFEEIEFENSFTDPTKTTNIIMYDGFEIKKIISEIIPETELQSDKFHLVFTTKLTCTYDFEDYRYHGRAVICSNPSVISTTGIIEAPAKPRDYYFDLFSNISQGLNLDAMKNHFKGRYLEYHDSKLGEVVKGYAMQAIFYYLTGKPFCDLRDCRLYNAHWQEDLLHSQIKIGTLCAKHQQVLDQIATNYE